MSLRAVALWLAACVLAARAQLRWKPYCESERCLWESGVQGEQEYTDHFVVNGKSLDITTSNVKSLYAANCSAAALDDPAWPRLPHREGVKMVKLQGCAPPPYGYASALRVLNVNLTSELELKEIPPNSNIKSISLSELPSDLVALTLSSSPPASLELEPGALTSLEDVRHLTLERVRADRFPPRLDQLTLMDTGIQVLPDEALSVAILKIQEHNLTLISGWATRLWSLTLNSTSLRAVLLLGVSEKLLRAGIVADCPALETIEFHGARGHALPAGVLSGASQLLYFTYTQGNLSALAPALFGDSPRLQFVDFSYNNLKTLPLELFSGLSELRVLRLEHNLLKATELRAVTSFASLTSLALGGNPLGDLCSVAEASLPSLHQLQELYLSRTHAKHVCSSWFHHLPELKHLDYSGNRVTNVSCGDFHVPGGGSDVIVVDLTNNPIAGYDCKVNGSVGGQRELKKVKVLTDAYTPCECDCPSLWQCNGTAEASEYSYPLLSLKMEKEEKWAVNEYLFNKIRRLQSAPSCY